MVKILLVNGKSYTFEDSELVSCLSVNNNQVITVKHVLDNIPCISTYYFPVNLIHSYSEVGDIDFEFDELTDDPDLDF